MTYASALGLSSNAAAAQAAQAANAPRGPATVEAAVRNASAKTGVDFSYLMEKAAVESGYRTDVKSSSSSATGLYQFIDSTWLQTMKEHGAEYGLGKYANAIQTRSDGRAYVADPATKQEILDLRKDPNTSALMAAAFTKDNKDYLEETVNGNIGSTELYMAHFLGAGGASKFLNAMQENPNRSARDLFPEAAAANKNVFTDKETGKGKTLKEIYDRFASKFSENPVAKFAPAQAATDAVRKQDMTDGFTTQVPMMPSKALNGTPLSIYQVLALNALETPDEVDSANGKQTRPRDKEHRRMRDEPVRTDQAADAGVSVGLGLGLGRVVGSESTPGGLVNTVTSASAAAAASAATVKVAA
ncbi:transglycosylase SLT domain-containing protein [Azospirillum cavernae]|uniref:transglycosylase SLT domain-containing protein n=1 Tax=Azospirillum cavernae TaxID=2320860 RepID=UPI001EE61450|nr:transglycosylase SLT domain-containing protein [Azospirillum cavernae]